MTLGEFAALKVGAMVTVTMPRHENKYTLMISDIWCGRRNMTILYDYEDKYHPGDEWGDIDQKDEYDIEYIINMEIVE